MLQAEVVDRVLTIADERDPRIRNRVHQVAGLGSAEEQWLMIAIDVYRLERSVDAALECLTEFRGAVKELRQQSAWPRLVERALTGLGGGGVGAVIVIVAQAFGLIGGAP